MKIAFVVLAMWSYALCTDVQMEKRLLIDTLFNATHLKDLVSTMYTTLGSGATEAACEAECHVVIQANHLLQAGCPLICKSFQSFVQRYGLHTG